MFRAHYRIVIPRSEQNTATQLSKHQRWRSYAKLRKIVFGRNEREAERLLQLTRPDVVRTTRFRSRGPTRLTSAYEISKSTGCHVDFWISNWISIIVTTLGLNIVIAVLVDRFSELREKRVRHFSCSLLLGDEKQIRHCIVFLPRTKSKKTN